MKLLVSTYQQVDGDSLSSEWKLSLSDQVLPFAAITIAKRATVLRYIRNIWKWISLTHWGRVTHICVGKLIIIGWDNGLSPDRRQAIISTNAGLLSIGPLRTYFSENLIKIQQFPLKKIHMKMSSAKWRSSCLGLNVLKMYLFPCVFLKCPCCGEIIWRKAHTRRLIWAIRCALWIQPSSGHIYQCQSGMTQRKVIKLYLVKFKYPNLITEKT